MDDHLLPLASAGLDHDHKHDHQQDHHHGDDHGHGIAVGDGTSLDRARSAVHGVMGAGERALPRYARHEMLRRAATVLFGAMAVRVAAAHPALAAAPYPCFGFDGCSCCNFSGQCCVSGCSSDPGHCPTGSSCWSVCDAGNWYQCCDFKYNNHANHCICSRWVQSGAC